MEKERIQMMIEAILRKGGKPILDVSKASEETVREVADFYSAQGYTVQQSGNMLVVESSNARTLLTD